MWGTSPVSWPRPSTGETASLFPPCPLDARSLSRLLTHKVSVAEVGKAVAWCLCGVTTAAWGQKTWVLGFTLSSRVTVGLSLPPGPLFSRL